MTCCEYSVLGYAASELQVEAVPFVVIFQVDEVAQTRLHTYIRADWEGWLESDVSSTEYIEDVLFEIRQQPLTTSSEAGTYFETLRDLSIGPLRTTAAGCLDDRRVADTILAEISEGLCSERDFARILQEITKADHKLHAAARAG